MPLTLIIHKDEGTLNEQIKMKKKYFGLQNQ